MKIFPAYSFLSNCVSLCWQVAFNKFSFSVIDQMLETEEYIDNNNILVALKVKEEITNV